MEKRKRRSIIFLRKSHLGQRVRSGSGKLTVAIIAEDLLKICPSARWAIQISIAFANRKISVRPAGATRIIVKILLIFGNGEIVELASEKRVGIVELTAVRRFAFPGARFRELVR